MPAIPQVNYDTVLQADKNLFVLGQISCCDGGRGYITCSVNDAKGDVRKVQVSAHYYRPSDSQIQYNALTMPVLAGEKYTVSAKETNASITTTFWTVDWS
jgi:hypothetical protein